MNVARCFLGVLLICVLGANLPAADVMYILGNEQGLTEGNEAILDLFEDRGDEVEIWDNTLLQGDPDAALEAADEADLVFIDESVSSGRVDSIIETTTPVINNEQYAFDNWGMAGLVVGHGSPPRPSNDGSDLDAGSSFGTTIEIVDSAHPIAARAGVSGLVQIYDDVGGRIDWGRPGDEADIVAQLPEFEDYQPASPIFVYEEGSTLVDGTKASGMRIGFFISDTNRGPEPDDPDVPDDGTDNSWEGREATLLTEQGLALLTATIDYALGIANAPGDFNGNGVLDIEDINQLGLESASRANNVAFDLNDDAKVNATDVNIWVKDLKKTWVGDANLDFEFNSGDFVQVFTAGKYEQQVDAVWAEGDWNGDGRFDSGDFVVAFTDGGYELGPAAVAAVPEPSTSILLMTTVFLGGWVIRRRG